MVTGSLLRSRFWVVTQRFSPTKRCVTAQITAAEETKVAGRVNFILFQLSIF